MARRFWSSVTLMHLCGLVALCLLLFGSRTGRSALTGGSGGHNTPGGDDNDFGIQMSTCPIECDCHGLTVDCSRRGLTFVPKFMPPEVRRLNLEANNLTVIHKEDFAKLSYLKILLLNDNNIHTIENGAFDDLKSLERINLGRNPLVCDCHLKWLAEYLQVRPTLDTADAKCEEPKRNARKRLTQLHPEKFKCKDSDDLRTKCPEPCSCDGTIVDCSNRQLKDVPTDLPIFSTEVRLNNNHINKIRNVGLFKKSPNLIKLDLRNNEITDIEDESFSGAQTLNELLLTENKLKQIRPEMFSGLKNLTNIRLEQNQITEVPPKTFSQFKRLTRIDLSKNNITRISPDAFSGLKSLNSLFLFGNEITDLPEGVFKGLSSLQLLLLNANRITCIRKATFADLNNLNLLSLYDNNIQSLADGVFRSITNIQTIHLGRNPFICDCNLKWLAEYLQIRPTLETSEARCEEPKRNARKRISQLSPEKFKCRGMEELRTKYAEQCMVDTKCPENCVCDATIVDCSRRDLKDIPNDIPTFATELRLNDNHIYKVRNTGLFKKLPNLIKLDLRNNEITDIEDGSFQGANMLNDLLITENKLRQIRPKMFVGLKNITNLMLRTNQISCITNDSFSDLDSLKLLSLYDNKIRCIMPGAFEKMKSLSTLNLLSNPLNCNCHMKWLSNWLKKQNIVTGNPRCQSPVDLRDIPIEDIELKDFKCDEMERDMYDCGPDALCPARCTCTGSVVRCSRQKLKAVPRYIQSVTSELYLDVNDISSIPLEINQLRDLTRLDLSNNQISILQNNIFANLSELQTLILSYNKLQCIQSQAFRGLKKLRVLSLHGNDISMIPDGSFTDLVSISHIAMGANPLYCDCNLRWLAEWIQKDFVEGGIARCHEPRAMRDKLIMSAPPNHFICTENPDPQILAKCDTCYTFPCANGATCRPKPLRDFECECAPGFHGQHCEYKIDACFGNPCDNGGTCKVMETGRFSCHCAPGFEGDRCETNIDDCIANKCENNATCVDQIESYRCDCLSGFGGEYCETKIQFCQKEYNPCKNGAQCVDHFTHYECICPTGYSGQNCTDNIDDCVDNLCQNGGTCVDSVNGYRCDCPLGFAGKYCELAPMVELYPQTSPCQQHDCKHGICFLPSGSSDYICKCSPGYSGKHCDMLSSMSFKDGSYLELEPLKTVPSVNITLKFVTRKQSGVVLYTGENQHLAVELFKGRIRISLDVGNYPVSTMFSYETVSDGRYHQLEFILIKKNFTMKVDGGQHRTIVNEGVKEYLETKSSLFIGGMSPEVANTAVRNWQIWNTSSLEGCMREIYINGNPPDLSAAKRQHMVAPGCQEFDDINKPCLNHLCQNGKCVPTNDLQTYECKCKGGWSGPFCDQAPTCQKEVKRDFYYENSCRSTKKLKLSQCVGSCGDNCCKPLKVKRRSVRLACSDGSKFTKEVDIVRKCGCAKKC